MMPRMQFLGGLLWRIVSLAGMAVIAFGWDKSAWKRSGVFVLLSMALGGASLSIGHGNFLTLLLTAGGVWALCIVAFGGRVGGREYVPVELTYGEKTVSIVALRDSGNTLRDPVSGEQVLVVSGEVAERLTGLTQEQLRVPLKTLMYRPVPGLRLIPYRAVGQAGDMLLAMRFDGVKIGNRTQSAVVALRQEGLGRGDVYQALTEGSYEAVGHFAQAGTDPGERHLLHRGQRRTSSSAEGVGGAVDASGAGAGGRGRAAAAGGAQSPTGGVPRRRFENTGVNLEDLISIGTIGLIKAISTYRLDKKIKLATYASRCIENEILMYIRKTANQKTEVSLDEPINMDCDGNELLLSDILGTDEDMIMRPLEDDVDICVLRQALRDLPDREREIVLMRFGLEGRRELTQKEVAQKMGISQSYISRLEKRIMLRLKKEFLRQTSCA